MRAVVYARISSDPDDKRVGVDRQQREGEKLAERNGWTLVETIVDNDASGRTTNRTGFKKLVTLIENDEIDVAIVQHTDRLARNVEDALAFYRLCSEHDVKIETWGGAAPTPDTASGKLSTTMLAAVDAWYADVISEKIKASHASRAAKGEWGGGRRPFGYIIGSTIDADGPPLLPHPKEAPALREAAHRYAEGESVLSIVRWLEAEGLKGTAGGRINPLSLRRMLTSPTSAGYRRVDNTLIEATWEPIIDRTVWTLCVARDAARPRQTKRRARKLLSGVLVCSACERGLVSQRSGKYDSYRCNRAAGGCGEITITMNATDDFVTQQVLVKIASTDLDQLLAARAANDDSSRLIELSKRARRYENDIESLSQHWVDADEALRTVIESQQRTLAERLTTAKTQLAAITVNADDAGEARLIGVVQAVDIVEFWRAADVETRRALVRLVVDKIVVAKAGRTGSKYRPDRLTIRWRDNVADVDAVAELIETQPVDTSDAVNLPV